MPGVYYIKNADGSYTLDEDEWDNREYYKKGTWFVYLSEIVEKVESDK